MMKKELSASMKKLTKKNRRTIMKMEQYMETRRVNEVACEDILCDIVGMALEAQERGEDFNDVIGGDYEQFCRELVKNAPKQRWSESILDVLFWLTLFSTVLMPSLYIVEVLFPSYSPSEYSGLVFSPKVSFLLKYYAIMFFLIIGWFFVKFYTYKPTKYVMGTYIAAFMLLYLFGDGFIAYFVKASVFNINVLIWVLVLGALLLILWLFKRLAAFTAVHQKRK